MLHARRARFGFMLALALLSLPASAQQFTLMPGAFPDDGGRWTEGIEVSDIDHDGDLDVFLAHGGGWSDATVITYPNTLLRNKLVEDGSFALVDESASRLGNHVSGAKKVIVGDIQDDGWDDALFCNSYDGNPPSLYRNLGDAAPGTFAFEGLERGLVDALHSYSGAFGDLDDDGDLDLVLTDATTWWDPILGGPGAQPVLGKPRLYLNDGEGFFNEAGAPGWNPPVLSGSHDVQMCDIDGDWDVDVLVTNVSYSDPTHLLLSNDGGGAFTDISSITPVASPHCWETEVADLDGDTDVDWFALAIENGPFNEPFKAPNGPVRNTLIEAGLLDLRETPSEGQSDINECVLADYDVDGDLDAIVGGLYTPLDQVHRNDGGLVFTMVPGVIPAGPDPDDPTLDATLADIDGDAVLDYLCALGEAPGADWTNTLYLGSGPSDTLAPVVQREESLDAWLPLAGPWVVRAQVRDQVVDDGHDRLDARATYRVTDGSGVVHAGEVRGLSIASGLDRFTLPDVANGLGASLAFELHYTDRAGNETVTPTRTAALCGFADYGTNAGGANTLALDAAGSTALGESFSVTTGDAPGANVFFMLSYAPAQTPIFGGTLLVDVSQLVINFVVTTPIAGTSSIGFSIPVNANLVGFPLYVQTASQDGTQPNGWALSHGVKLIVCP